MNEIKWILKYPLMYQKEGIKAYSHGLNNIIELSNYLGNPQNFFKSIHIAGTNGKGSTSHMLASILQEAKYRVGLLTSPHFNNFSERIQYNGIYIDKKFIIYFIKKYKNFLQKKKYSFFEIITSLAFLYFKYKKVDIAIIEVGMGGRFDSTNIINPIISIITHIGWDHTDILGNTLNEIAYQKAGIIKNNIPIIIGPNVSGTEEVFIKVAKEKNANIFFCKKNKNIINNSIIGYSEFLNKNTILKTIEILRKLKFIISNKNLENGFQNVIKNTNLLGRWHILKRNPKIICDIAHNEDAIKSVNEQISYESYKNLHIILGFVKGKKILKILSFLPKEANYYFCQPNIDRAFPINKIKKLTKEYLNNSKYFISFMEAFLFVKQNACKKDLIFIGGSTFIVAEIYNNKKIFL